MQTPWAVILCKFKDATEEPFSKQYYKDLFTVDDAGSPWNMVRYFNDYSHGALDLTGTQVFGWYQLDKTVDQYNALDGVARRELIKWARQAALDGGVGAGVLNSFYSTVVCTNGWKDIGAWTGDSPTGVVAQGTTPIPAVLGEEMGHVYGLNHSRIDGSQADYTDPWDGMSA
jgi:hypothetical protein